MVAAELQIALRVQSGRESECARELWTGCPERYRKILAALAAELVSLHESAALGATSVLVVTADQLPAVRKELDRAGSSSSSVDQIAAELARRP